MTFNDLKDHIQDLSPQQLTQVVTGFFGEDLMNIVLVATPEGELLFIPEFKQEESA